MSTDFVSKTASVKVMRSFDYCHFEINIGLESEGGLTLVDIDSARKEAARLADKAVEQYKVAKANAQKLLGEKEQRRYLKERVERTRATPEGERTISQQAELKAFDDEAYQASRAYDYEDDWQDDD